MIRAWSLSSFPVHVCKVFVRKKVSNFVLHVYLVSEKSRILRDLICKTFVLVVPILRSSFCMTQHRRSALAEDHVSLLNTEFCIGLWNVNTVRVSFLVLTIRVESLKRRKRTLIFIFLWFSVFHRMVQSHGQEILDLSAISGNSFRVVSCRLCCKTPKSFSR